MSAVVVAGCGVVSPAGWGVPAFRDALAKRTLLPSQELARPDVRQSTEPIKVMRVPAANPRPAFLSHPRLRRSSSITQFAVGAALEALGPREPGSTGDVGVIVCVFSGCVNYSRRFYHETLKDPAIASPLVFPETVFNAPASHISAYLGSHAINYTLVGDAGTFLTALAIGAGWILEERVAECVVVGTEEIDWLTADALKLFERKKVLSEGAGALLLRKENSSGAVCLNGITDEFLYSTDGKASAIQQMHDELGGSSAATLLVESTMRPSAHSKEESAAWAGWQGTRLAPKEIFGEGLMAAAAWQAVAAADALNCRTSNAPNEALISIAGFHQHAIGARLERI